VTRISRELAQVREEVQELRGGQQRMKEMVPRIQEGIDAGIKHPGELTQLKGELEQLSQREHRYAVCESRLVNDLEGATALLNDLNDKLNALVELEMTPK
jgi:hypothetical protein